MVQLLCERATRRLNRLEKIITMATMSAEMVRVVRLPPPDQLPESNFPSAKFKPFYNHAMAFLGQNPDSDLYMRGGAYEKWLPQNSVLPNKRIVRLLGKDVAYPPEPLMRVEALSELGLPPTSDFAVTAQQLAAAKLRLKEKRMVHRNNQLSMLLQQFANLVFWSEQDDVTDRSDSLEWIWSYLRSHYNIEAKGSNILKVTEHIYRSGDNPNTFYKQFRASVIDNLRKAGSLADPRIPDDRLAQDEKLSPTFEDMIIIWALEKIDARLPGKVRKDYEGRLHGDTYLWNLQPQIFQRIPAMLEELQRAADIAALTLAATKIDYQVPSPTQASAGLAGFQGGRPAGRGMGRGGGRGRGRGRSSEPAAPPRKREWSLKYCKFCKKEGKPQATYESHNSFQCSFLSVEEKQNFLIASLQALGFLEDEEDDCYDDDAPVQEGELQGLDTPSS